MLQTRSALSLLVLVAAASCNIPADEPAIEEVGDQLTSGGTYVLKLPKMVGDTGNCVQVAGSSLDNLARLQEWDCNGSGAQSFIAEDAGNGYYRLKNTNSGKCANVYNGAIDAAHPKAGNQDGTIVQQYTCGTGDNNYWKFVASNGYYQIVSKLHTGDGKYRCLDVTGGDSATANGTGLELWTCGSSKGNQTFNPVSASGGGGTTCSFPSWVAGKSYVPGNIVTYPANGKFYICTNANPGYDPTISTWFWSPYTCSGGTGGGGTASGIAGVVSSSQFEAWFPSSGSCGGHACRNPFYTYTGLTSTASAYPTFANSTDSTLRKREVAAFLANLSWESDWFHAVREYDTSNYCNYCDRYAFGCGGNVSCACPAGSCNYYGRGPIQLSWPANYKAAGSAIGADLLNNPDLVATKSDIAWKTGVWYWMTGYGPGGYGNNCHEAMMASSGSGGFGSTIKHINGAQECPSLGGSNTSARDERIRRYKMFCDLLGVTYGNNLGC